MAEIVHKLKINGMTCGGCSKRVTTVLNKALWVIDADISHETGKGYITTLTDVSIDRVIEIVNSTGYHAIEI
jgi:copper chaperone CopZ